MSTKRRYVTYLIGLLAVSINLLFSPIPAKLGLYRLLAWQLPVFIGLSPAFLDPSQPWGYTFDELAATDLSGQTALVTGANSGIGYEISLALARGGASVTMACRNKSKCDAAAARIFSDDAVVIQGKIQTMTMDTSSLDSVRKFCDEYLRHDAAEALDILYLNAGIGTIVSNDDGRIPQSVDGIENMFATNVVGHHLLYNRLAGRVAQSEIGRVVLTSSAASFNVLKRRSVATDLETLNSGAVISAYAQSKLAQILWAKELTRRLGLEGHSHVYVNAGHPGAVETGIWDKIEWDKYAIARWLPLEQCLARLRRLMWTSAEGALTLLFLGVAVDRLVEGNDGGGIRGRYFHPQSMEVINPKALDEDLQKRVWMFLDDLVADFV